MVASYFAQGAFKEAMQALFVLAFALALREVARNPDWRGAPLRFVPAALIAVGTVYAYSYPGLVWLVGDARSSGSARAQRRAAARRPARAALRAARPRACSPSSSWSPPRSGG